VELLHGEGGDDAKLFVSELKGVYRRYAAGKGLSCEVLDDGHGHAVLKFTGRGAGKAFAMEAGNHCVQRVPNNDRSGRMQTSFVAVAVLPLPPEKDQSPLPWREVEVTCQTGKQRAGGQNVNKVASAVRMVHKPTGLRVFINGRDQGKNKREALRVLTAKVNAARNEAALSGYTDLKSRQLAARGRGAKVRTYNLAEKHVTDHRTGKQTRDVKSVMKGNLSLVL
jgi:peptide chain release factor 1